MVLTEAKVPALATAHVGVTRWFRNVGLVASFGGAFNDRAGLAAFELGIRLIGSGTSSGPFAGVGLGALYVTIGRNEGREGFVGDAVLPTFSGELGIVARGRFLASMQAGVPLGALEGTMHTALLDGVGTMRMTRATITPIAIAAQVGWMF